VFLFLLPLIIILPIFNGFLLLLSSVLEVDVALKMRGEGFSIAGLLKLLRADGCGK